MSHSARALSLMRDLERQTNKMRRRWQGDCSPDDAMTEITETQRLLNLVRNAVRASAT